jgi:pyruvate dehydrogenase E1 component
MTHFRREVIQGKGLSSYPHPWLMPDFWEFPTVSMGLGPIAAIYQARFNRYMQHRGIIDTSNSRVWAFLGDGECDEPESLGALHLAASEQLGNLIFVVNCNLQRLDGPVRGNGKIIQELEAGFHGAGWRVIKVVWGREWDPLLAADNDGVLVSRMGEAVDGMYQKYSVEPGAYTRNDFFGADPRLLKMVEHLSDDDIRRLRRGGHDFRKVYAAFKAACEEEDKPTVILAKTVKGWTLGGGAEGRNVAHNAKKLALAELGAFRDRLHLDIPDDQLEDPPFVRFSEDAPAFKYMVERRRQLGGFVPTRKVVSKPYTTPKAKLFDRYLKGSGDREVSTTGAFGRMLADFMNDKEIGNRIVPIIPDEARTFGLDALFNRYGIYSSKGQLYEPVDRSSLLYYREALDGQVLEEGICEAGSMASMIAAATSYATLSEPMVPVYIFYSMFGFQRTGDQAWQLGDQRGRGFMIGATSGRTTLNGEGLQHQDGHSHLLAATHPTCMAYDPAFAYEIAIIMQDGLKRILEDEEDGYYYITVCNENYVMPPMPKGVEQGILDGIYPYKKSSLKKPKHRATLFGSGSIMNGVLEAQEILAKSYGVAADVWSATSYCQLRRQAMACERWNMLHPQKEAQVPKVAQLLAKVKGPVVAASDYMTDVPNQIGPWVPGGLFILGTDGFGRSDTRTSLRRHFEVDAQCITIAVLKQLADRGEIEAKVVSCAIKDLGVDPEKPNPATA